MKSGNNTWWDQVRDVHEGMPSGTHFKEAEMEVFRILYTRMIEDGMTQGAIREHFKDVFNLGYSAFYGRLRKVGCRYVIA